MTTEKDKVYPSISITSLPRAIIVPLIISLVLSGLLTVSYDVSVEQSGQTPLGQRVPSTFSSPRQASTGTTLQLTQGAVVALWAPAYKTQNIKDLNLKPTSTLTVSVNITRANGIYGYEFDLAFDDTVLIPDVVRWDGTIFFPTTNVYWDNVTRGNAIYIITFSNLQQTFSGNGVLAFIDFTVVGYGSIGLGIDNLRLFPDQQKTTLPGCFENIEVTSPNPDFQVSPAPSPSETSEFFAGKVAVGIILPESVGPLYNWTDAEVSDTVNGIVQAMDWWDQQEPLAGLSFRYDLHIRVPTLLEPIRGPIGDQSWISEVMGRIGYSYGSAWEQVRAYNNDIRARYGSDWAFTFFVVDSDPSYQYGNFADGEYAWAFFGGPWVVMSRDSTFAWNSAHYLVAVPAHETGHIFYATDQYNSYKEHSGYLNAVDVWGLTSIMNQNTLLADSSTKRQVGWSDCNLNGILDVLDTRPALRVEPIPSPLVTPFLATGAAVDVPYPNQNPYGTRRSVTINKIVRVEYSISGGAWQPAIAADGFFDEALETFTLQVPALARGTYTMLLRVVNSIGNESTMQIELQVETSSLTFTHIIPFSGLTVTASGDLTLGSLPGTIAGTITVTVVNSTSGSTVFAGTFDILVAVGPGDVARFILVVPAEVPLLGVSCNISLSGSSTCMVSRNPDVNNDRKVNLDDLLLVFVAQGTELPFYDLDANGLVDLSDLLIVYAHQFVAILG